MSTLSMADVVRLAYQAGIRNPADLAKSAAIATAESGRNPAAIGDVSLEDATWGPSVGLWQVRSLKADQGKNTVRDAAALANPAFNAQAMYSISKGGSDWSPWSTASPTKDPLGYAVMTAALPAATAAVSVVLPTIGASDIAGAAANAASAVTDPITQLASTVNDAVQLPSRLLNWFTEPGTWLRVGFWVGGSVLLLGSLIYLAKRPAETVAKTVAPIAKKAAVVAAA